MSLMEKRNMELLGKVMSGVDLSRMEQDEVSRLLDTDPSFRNSFFQALNAKIAVEDNKEELQDFEEGTTTVTSWQRPALAAAAAIILALSAIIANFLYVSTYSRNARVAASIGEANISKEDQRQILTCGNLSLCDFDIPAKGDEKDVGIRAFSGTRFELSFENSAPIITIREGSLLVTARRQSQEQSLRIRTENASVTFLGTSLYVESNSGMENFSVVEGTVEVSFSRKSCRTDGGRIILTESSAIRISDIDGDICPSSPSNLSPDEMAEMKSQLASLNQSISFRHSEGEKPADTTMNANLLRHYQETQERSIVEIVLADGSRIQGYVEESDLTTTILQINGQRVTVASDQVREINLILP